MCQLPLTATVFGSGSHPSRHPEAVGIVVDLQPGGCQPQVLAIQHHHPQQSFDVPCQIGQQQAKRRGAASGSSVARPSSHGPTSLFKSARPCRHLISMLVVAVPGIGPSRQRFSWAPVLARLHPMPNQVRATSAQSTCHYAVENLLLDKGTIPFLINFRHQLWL